MQNWMKNIDDAPVGSLDLSWDSLSVNTSIVTSIQNEFKFTKMTPVQAATIPLMLSNKDVIVEAKTGSGKTLAFLIPIVEALIRQDTIKTIASHDVFAIIMSPTRELASQIHQELRKLLKSTLLPGERRIVNLLIVGGNNVSADLQKYTKYGGNIIVATPGRLSAIMEMADNNMSECIRKKLAYLIFDEADQLLSLGFERNLSSILGYLPKQRRTSLFSATQTTEVEDLIKSGLRNPIRVDVNKLDSRKKETRNRGGDDCDIYKTLKMPDRLTNYHHVCDSYAHKIAVLSELIKADRYQKILVFLATCSQIEYFSWCLEQDLKDRKIKVLKLHRRLKNKRKAIYANFKSSKKCVLLVTDILSRGIDVPDITCVIHLDLPESPECYVHRSGRSGHQIDLDGISLLLLEKHELDYIEMCKRRKIEIRPMDMNKMLRSEPSRIDTVSSSLKLLMKRHATDDKEYRTLGMQAFVSYIRYYSSKLCLRLLLYPKLSIAQLAASFGLLRLPKMPELRKTHKIVVAEFKQLSSTPKQETVETTE